MPATKEKYLEFKRRTLLAQLQGLLDRIDDPKLSAAELDEIKAEVADCQRKYKELGF